MGHYHFFMFQDGEVVGQTDCLCASDSEALAVAGVFPAFHAVEVYSDNGFGARVNQDG